MPRFIRMLVLVVVFLVSGSTLAGCVGIPTGGPVVVGQKLAAQNSDDFEFFPLAPAEGATQEQILRGFIAAFTGSAGDYEVARQFLSSGFAGRWNPRSNVVVRTSNEGRASVTGDLTMQLSLNAAATVDESGAYRENIEAVPIDLEFDFVQENGQWRIDRAADGIVLSDATFRSLFDRHALYFLDPTNRYLVPDLRWFASGSSTLRIVSTLLEGPPAWLGGAVQTAFPDGTRLSGPRVDVQAGVATVYLSTEALAGSATERQLMRAQLSASLSQVSNIRAVTLLVSGTPLPAGDSTETPLIDPDVDGRPAVLRDGRFGYLSGGNVSSIGTLSAGIEAASPIAVSLSARATFAAVLGGSGASLVTADQSLLLDSRTDLVPPTLDSLGWVFTAARSDPQAVTAWDSTGAPVRLLTGFGSDSVIESFDLSRDGTRMAFVVSTPSGPRLLVKSLIRGGDGGTDPTGFGEAILDSPASTGTAADSTWVDDVTVAVLANVNGEKIISLWEVGGERTALGRLEDAVAIVGGNGRSGLRVLAADGTVIARSGNGWTNTGVTVSFLATQS